MWSQATVGWPDWLQSSKWLSQEMDEAFLFCSSWEWIMEKRMYGSFFDDELEQMLIADFEKAKIAECVMYVWKF